MITAAALAKYEAGVGSQQTLRRGRRTLYVRVYDVPHGQMDQAATTGVFLPEAGDFLPGESSGACVLADGVSILPIDNKGLVGLRVAITAQYPVYENLNTSGGVAFPLGAYFIEAAKSEAFANSNEDTQYRFEVPVASWTGLTVPAKGDATPAKIGWGGAIIDKRADYDGVPGFVVCTLTCHRPTYQDLSSSGSFPLGAFFVEGTKVEQYGGQPSTHGQTAYRFEVLQGSWAALTPPAKGDATPAALGGLGAVRDKRVDHESLPGFVVVTLVCGAPIYTDKTGIGGTAFPLGAYFVKGTDGEDSVGTSQYDSFRFEVPTGATPWPSIPASGDARPASLGTGGTLLTKRVDRDSIPGFVVYTLLYGWRWVTYDPLTRVSCRTVTVNRKQKVALDGTTPLAGPVTGEEESQRYAMLGDEDSVDETYVQITITSIVSTIPAGWQGSNFNKRNQAAVTLRGVTYALGKVLYTGGASEDVTASNSPTGVAAYKLTLVLLAAGKAWPLTTTRYIEKKKVVQIAVVDVDGVEVGKSRVSQWVRDATTGTSQTIRAEFDMVAALGSLP